MILHVMILEKFMPPFIDFIMKYFDVSRHRFVFITSPKYEYGLNPHHPVEFLHREEDFLTLAAYFDSAEKIILHGLWRDKVNDLLFQKKLWLDKTFWTMWGGDFYYPERYKPNHKKVIESVFGLISYIPGDIDFVRKLYRARGKGFSSFFYLSNAYLGPTTDPHLGDRRDIQSLNVMLGHSGAIENNHIHWIKYFSDIEGVTLFSPLAYPKNSDYVAEVIASGKEFLDDRFNPMLEFFTREKYEFFLNNIDLAIMPSWRQHGMGNIISLLGRGIPVVMHAETTSRQFFLNMGVNIYSIEQVDIAIKNIGYEYQNAEIIKNYFSVDQLASDWGAIFNS